MALAARHSSETGPAVRRAAEPAAVGLRPGRGEETSSAGPPGSRRRYATTIFFVWTGVAFFLATQRWLRGPSLQPGLALPWGELLAASLVTAYIWALLTPFAMSAARRWRPAPGTAGRNSVKLAG